MASPVPAKSQSLHNFSLPLQWSSKGNNHHSSHRGRRSSSGTSPPPSSSRRLSPSDSDADCQTKVDKFSSADAGGADVEEEARDVRSKINIRIRKFNSDNNNENNNNSKNNNNNENNGNCDKVQDGVKVVIEEEEIEECLAKTWNFRPRRPIKKLSNNGNHNRSSPRVESHKNSPQRSNPNRSGVVEPEAAEKKEKEKEKENKFSIYLTKQEVEEDVFVMTGSKPARRPRKRPRNVQKQLDSIFPGLWLSSITPDCYKVCEALPPKV